MPYLKNIPDAINYDKLGPYVAEIV